jgi:hypothetical protein
MTERIPRLLFLLAALGPSAAGLALEDQDPRPKTPPPRPTRVIVKPAKQKLPERVALPAAGEHPVEDLLSQAGVLTGLIVRIDSDRVRETKVMITEAAAGSQVTLDELKLLLAAHRVYLFPFTDPKEGEILVASRNPQWKDEPPRHTKIIEIGTTSFKAAWAKVAKAVDEKNAALPKGEPAVFAVPDERTGKIFLGASSAEALERIASLVETPAAKDPDRLHLYTYTGSQRRVEDLQKELLESLNESERNRLVIVVSSKGNRLLLKAPASLWETVEAKLKELDKKK